jgi:hypothetical protein
MRSTRICVTLLLFPLFTTILYAGWTRTGDTKGNHVQCLAQSAGYLFAGSWGGGIYRSSDNGITWTPSNSGLLVSVIYAFGTTPGWVFAGTASGGGVFRSSDNGGTWQLAMTGLPSNLTVYGFATVEDSGRTNLFIAAYNAVYRSTDNGANWTASRTGATTVRAIGTLGNQVFTGGTEGVYRTTNLGATWARADSGMAKNYVSAFTSAGSTIYATVYSGGVYKSTDGGIFWTSAGLGTRNLWSLASTDSVVYAGEYQKGVYRTTNGGSTWTSLGPSGMTVQALLAGGSRVFAGTWAGVYPSTNGGTSWQSVLLSSPRTLSIVGTNRVYAGGYGGVTMTTDGGTTWTFSGIPDWVVTAVAVRGSIAVAAAGGGGIFISTDDGGTWTAQNNGLSGKTPNSVLITDDGSTGIKLHTGTTYTGIYASSDTGKNWSQTSDVFYRVTGFASLGSVLLAGTMGESIYRSTDNGTTWTRPGTSSEMILSLVTNGNRIYAGTNGGGVLVSMDTGSTFTTSGLADAVVRSLATTGTKVFAGGSTGIWLTMNNGASWSMMNTGLTDTSVYSLWINGPDLYASVSSGGVWKRPLSELVTEVSGAADGIPHRFELMQNYPNPFNPKTGIRYQVPGVSDVRLEIHDVLGREVAVLVNERKLPGRYEVTFDGSALSSGLYICHLTAGSYVHSMKMLLVK